MDAIGTLTLCLVGIMGVTVLNAIVMWKIFFERRDDDEQRRR